MDKKPFESEHKHGGTTTTEEEKQRQHQGHKEPGQTGQHQPDQLRKHDEHGKPDQQGKQDQQGKHDQGKGGQGEQHNKN